MAPVSENDEYDLSGLDDNMHKYIEFMTEQSKLADEDKLTQLIRVYRDPFPLTTVYYLDHVVAKKPLPGSMDLPGGLGTVIRKEEELGTKPAVTEFRAFVDKKYAELRLRVETEMQARRVESSGGATKKKTKKKKTKNVKKVEEVKSASDPTTSSSSVGAKKKKKKSKNTKNAVETPTSTKKSKKKTEKKK